MSIKLTQVTHPKNYQLDNELRRSRSTTTPLTIRAIALSLTKHGNFEMDFEDGEIRYKTSIDVEGESLSFALIKKLVYANVTMMDEYLPGIIAAIKSNVSAKDAIAQIEA